MRAAFEDRSPEPLIRHAVAGSTHSCRIEEVVETITDFFQRYPGGPRSARIRYLGPDGIRFRFLHLVLGALEGRPGSTTRQRVAHLNRAFRPFTQMDFDFGASPSFYASGFEPREYVRTVCRGVYRHLMRQSDREVALGGCRKRLSGNDLRSAASRTKGNLALRASGFLVRKALQRMCRRVTFDLTSFKTAVEAGAERPLVVLPVTP